MQYNSCLAAFVLSIFIVHPLERWIILGISIILNAIINKNKNNLFIHFIHTIEIEIYYRNFCSSIPSKAFFRARLFNLAKRISISFDGFH